MYSKVPINQIINFGGQFRPYGSWLTTIDITLFFQYLWNRFCSDHYNHTGENKFWFKIVKYKPQLDID